MRKQLTSDEYRIITRIITTKTSSGVDVMGTAGSYCLLKYYPSFEGKAKDDAIQNIN